MKIACIGDHIEGTLRNVTLEEIAFAEGLKDKHGGEISLILLGSDLDVFTESLKNYDLSKIVYLEDPQLQLYNQFLYTIALMKYLSENPADILVMPHTSVGMDLAPSMAMEQDLPVITSCESAEYENGGWSAIRVIYGGKVKEKVHTDGSSVIVTLRPGDFSTAKEKPSSPEIVKLHPSFEGQTGDMTSLNIEKPVQEDVDITKYSALVAVGRGLGSADNIELVESLAGELNSALACTRPVVDQGWLPKGRQVGTSGKTVAPKLYLALGISGATNHINGMKKSSTIIAINKDPSAAIFEISDYGIVADLMDIVPLLVEELKKGA